jgi:hypothetical protein
MSENPEVERSDQNPQGKTNLKPSPETEERKVKFESAEESPKGNQMKNAGQSENIGTA